MKLELDENAYWACFWVIVCSAVVLIAAILSSDYTERTKAAFAAGYTEATLPGHNGAAWTKPKP
jgi:hypothetical protein